MALDNSSRSQCRALFVGLATIDAEYFLDDLPQRNQKVTAAGQMIAAGGPATNAAITFAFLGAEAKLVTAVGRHPLAQVIRHDLDHFGVSLSDVASDHDESPPLSSILILRRSGDRTVVSANAGAFSSLRYEIDLRWLENPSLILVDGHYMPLCHAVAVAARSRDIQVVLDAGSWKPGMDELLANVDVAICSDAFRPPGCMNEVDVFSYLSQRGVTSTAITHGEKPVRYVERGTEGEIAVDHINAIDTLGAGDIFHGAFCFWACECRHGFRESLQFAANVASLSCRHPGIRTWMEAFPGIDAMHPEGSFESD